MHRKLSLMLWCVLLLPLWLAAQVVYTDPFFPKLNEPVTIFFDATEGTGGLADCNCDVYLHTGVITTASSGPSDWKYVETQWGVANPDWQLTPVPGEPNLYSFEITPSIQEYYGVPAGEEVLEMAFVFRNATGTLEGKDDGGTDIFYPVYPDNFPFTSLLLSPSSPTLIQEVGGTINIRLVTSENATITLTRNGSPLTQLTGNALDYDLLVDAAGTFQVEITADNGDAQVTEAFTYAVPLDLPALDPPVGTQPGYSVVNDTTVRFALYAPNKEFVFLLGSFNDYNLDTDFQLRQSLDGNLHWIEVSGLTQGEAYTFQYLVSGGIRVADPYSTLVLDPWNDPFIPEVTYPDLPAYPEKAVGIVTWFQLNGPAYQWQTNDYERPAKEELVIYEMLLRDFIERHDYTTLIDTLDYLQRLGINALQLMPVNEFDGNISWGYNPAFHMALDKYYGPIDEFKRLVDECHARGMAVILDVVYNHLTGASPLAQLYWDAANNRPAADNPWLFPEARHPFNVFNDMNHGNDVTREYIDRVMIYWLEEFRIDGFRFDLSKGFSTTDYGDNVGAWGNYDAERIGFLKHYADVMWATTPDAYVILEHFANNTEEKELSDYGMMLWGNLNHDYNEATMGYNNNLSWGFYQTRGWDDPHVITYMESHDEERLMYKNLQFGNSAGNYDVRDFSTGLDRIELATAFFYTIPGPKMLWQFGEMGYDFSINYCENGTINDDCRTGPKPIRWDYLEDPDRRRLFDVTRSLIHLKTTYDVFNTTNVTHTLSNSIVKTVFLDGDEMDVAVQGNFGMTENQVSNPFPAAGMWYEYFSGDSLLVENPTTPLTLTPGEYRLYTTIRLNEPPGGYSTATYEWVDNYFGLRAAPNPAAGTVQLTYELPAGSRLQLELFDNFGRRLRTLAAGQYPAGPHMVDLETGGLAPGVYTLRLSADRKVEAERLVIVR